MTWAVSGVNSIDGDMSAYLCGTAGELVWGAGPRMFIFPKVKKKKREGERDRQDWVSKWETVTGRWFIVTGGAQHLHVELSCGPAAVRLGFLPFLPFPCGEEPSCWAKLPNGDGFECLHDEEMTHIVPEAQRGSFGAPPNPPLATKCAFTLLGAQWKPVLQFRNNSRSNPLFSAHNCIQINNW